MIIVYHDTETIEKDIFDTEGVLIKFPDEIRSNLTFTELYSSWCDNTPCMGNECVDDLKAKVNSYLRTHGVMGIKPN